LTVMPPGSILRVMQVTDNGCTSWNQFADDHTFEVRPPPHTTPHHTTPHHTTPPSHGDNMQSPLGPHTRHTHTPRVLCCQVNFAEASPPCNKLQVDMVGGKTKTFYLRQVRPSPTTRPPPSRPLADNSRDRRPVRPTPHTPSFPAPSCAMRTHHVRV